MMYNKFLIVIFIIGFVSNILYSQEGNFKWGVFSNITLSNFEFRNGEPFEIASSGAIYPSVSSSNVGLSAPFGWVIKVGLGESFIFNLRGGLELLRSNLTLENSFTEKTTIIIEDYPIQAEFKTTFTFKYHQQASIYFVNPNLEYRFPSSSAWGFFGLTYSILENKGELLEFSNYEEIVQPENVTFPNGTRRNEINGQLNLSPTDRTVHSFGVEAGLAYTFELDEYDLQPELRFSYYIIPREYELIDDFDLSIKQIPIISLGLSLLF
jgi:hypothetical protein